MGLGDINYVLHLCKDNRWISHKLSTEKSAVGNEPICKSYHLCNVIKLRVSLTFETLTRYYSWEQDNCTPWSCTAADTASSCADVTGTGRTH